MKRRSGIAPCTQHKHSRECRLSRPLCRWRRAATTVKHQERCACDGITWGGKGSAPHRKGSSAGKFGCCVWHPKHAELMYAELERPVRRCG